MIFKQKITIMGGVVITTWFLGHMVEERKKTDFTGMTMWCPKGNFTKQIKINYQYDVFAF